MRNDEGESESSGRRTAGTQAVLPAAGPESSENCPRASCSFPFALLPVLCTAVSPLTDGPRTVMGISVPSVPAGNTPETFYSNDNRRCRKKTIKKQLERLLKPFRISFRRDGEPLTEEQKRRRARLWYIRFMGLLCLGSLCLIFSPSKRKRPNGTKGKGFNVEMPSPEDSEMEGNKVSAYETGTLAKKEKWRRGTFQEMSESCSNNGRSRILPVLPQEKLNMEPSAGTGKGESPPAPSVPLQKPTGR